MYVYIYIYIYIYIYNTRTYIARQKIAKPLVKAPPSDIGDVLPLCDTNIRFPQSSCAKWVCLHLFHVEILHVHGFDFVRNLCLRDDIQQ